MKLWLIGSAWLAILAACPVVECAEPEENAVRETASKSPGDAGIDKDAIVAKTRQQPKEGKKPKGKTEEAKRRFEELANRFGTTWIGRASRGRLETIAQQKGSRESKEQR